MSLRSRLARLERLVKLMPAEAPSDTQRLRHVDAAADALNAMIVAVYPCLSDEESGRISQAFRASTGAFADWMRGLFAGQCRIVPSVVPAVWRDVLLAFVHPEATTPWTCVCGMAYPTRRAPHWSQLKLLPGKRPFEGPPPWYDVQEFFRACPACGADRRTGTWTHLTAPVMEGA